MKVPSPAVIKLTYFLLAMVQMLKSSGLSVLAHDKSVYFVQEVVVKLMNSKSVL